MRSNYSRFFLSSLVLVFGFATSGFAGQTDPTAEFLSQLEPLQSPQFFSTPETDHRTMVDAFNAAKKSIKIGIFGISDTTLVNALVAAEQRNVDVTIICDHSCYSSAARTALITQMRNAKINVVDASVGFSISHWKMFVVDEKRAFISTMNFIDHFSQMRDVGIFVSNPTIVSEILAVFQVDVENAKTGGAITPPLSQANLVWSPVNSETKLVALINSASTSIDILIENMGENNIHDALMKAVDRKVKVRVLTSHCGLGVPPSVTFAKLLPLMQHGVIFKGMPYPVGPNTPYIHAKTIDVDHKTVFLGSENFSFNSLIKARELGLIFRDSQTEKQLADLYEKDWSYATDFSDTSAPDTCNAFGVVL